MKNKMKFLIGMSLKRKIKTKWFAIANIALALLIIGLANIDNIINYFGGDFDNTTKIYVIDNTDKAYDLFNTYMEQAFSLSDNKYSVSLAEKSKDEIVTAIKDGEEDSNSILLIFNDSKENVINVEMISNDFIDTLDMANINSTINNVKVYMAIEKYNISEEQIAGLTSGITINRTILNEGKDSIDENMNMIMSTVFPVFILPFFMLIIFLVQMIGAEVNDEKTTRGMEIIISNVSPRVHFFSKCIAGNVFVILQSVLLICYGLIGFFARSFFGGGNEINNAVSEITGLLSGIFSADFISSLKYIIPLVLVLMVLTFIAYSLVAGILASMTTNTEDFQQIQTPIMLTTLAGYYLAMMAGAFKGSIIIKILGYFPFISAILSPSLLVMGEFTIFDVLISIVVIILVIYLLIRYGLKVYKVGILNYSSGNLWKKMLNALKAK